MTTLVLTADQRKTLTSLLNTYLAPLDKHETDQLVQNLAPYPTVQPDAIRHVLAPASCISLAQPDWHPIDDGVVAMINRAASPDLIKRITLLLSLLGSGAGMALLTQARWFTPFHDLSPANRTQVILQWQQSRFHSLRMIYVSFAAMTWQQSYGNIYGLPLHQAIGYPPKDPIRSQPGYQPRFERPRLPITRHLPPGTAFDVIVIGSGAGGGVVAAKLAQAGKSVLVIEKGPYVHESEFAMTEALWHHHFEDNASILSEQGNLNVMTGSVIGGTTTVNYSASLKLPHWARDEWAKLGLPYFVSQKFTKDMEDVCHRIGATTDGIRLTGANKVLKDGCEKLGYHVQLIPQNTGGEPHECHWCMGGCVDGVKNGSMNTWLRDAVDHGAVIMDRHTVKRVLVSNGAASGVEIFDHQTKTTSTIHAQRVIVSAGTMQSPGILRRSGLKNKHIGQHLNVHPCVGILGIFPDIQDVYKGTMMTTYSDAVANWNGDNYGAKIEGLSLHAGLNATMIPWRSALDHKTTMAKYRYSVPLLVVSRNKDSVGSVFYDGDQDTDGPLLYPDTGYKVRFNYQQSKHDSHSIVLGIAASAKILVAAGAHEVRSMQLNVPPFVFQENETVFADHPRFVAWLDQVVAAGAPAICSTAHEMGTCRMGASAKTSAVKPTGETWEVKGLFVADASVFPTSSGVNPMVTIMAIAAHISDNVLQSFDSPAKL
ncbi:long-chain fatty alcohol dehydrogenase [Hesseltinella vesiculosa]|uniref:Long-chain-alcohol oxidase n=1 Tax=Hesseltinella vesiculosa TaxID=101127 RepID=A0A1X2GKR8_9FUNG|nr:long-chain fatty alcohol dehydrogenase [Hesseltinella vesiculosa]